jgi:RNA polymerase sigma-70 factor (ECF subfamily)
VTLHAVKSAARTRTAVDDRSHLTRLLQETGTGHEPSFAELYDQTHLHLYRVAVRLLKSPDHAVEVVQEAYLEVWLKARRYDSSKGTALGWMMMIVHRRAIDRIRAVHTATARDLRSAAREHSERSEDLSEDVVARLDARRVREAMTSLSVNQRQAVVLKYVDGRTLKEISDELSLPLGTVKTRIRDGLARLRNSVQPDHSCSA